MVDGHCGREWGGMVRTAPVRNSMDSLVDEAARNRP